jgi:hypothetical protein
MRTIPLGGKKAAGRIALIDDGDYDLVTQHPWHVQEQRRSGRPTGPYAAATVRTGSPPRGSTILMHCLILGQPGVDHRNGNGLDNRRANLRPATHAQNQRNQRPRIVSTSEFKGVSWDSHRLKWHARIARRHLGRFDDELAAAKAYDAAARELYGEFAWLNFPPEGEL